MRISKKDARMRKLRKEPAIGGEASQIVIDSFPFVAWLKDQEGTYLSVNQSFATYSGKPIEEIIGKKDIELYSPEEAAIYIASDQAVLSGEKSGSFEALIDGKWKEEYKSIAKNSAGDVIGTAGFARYITERKKIEAQLNESERSKAVLLSNLPGLAFRCKNDVNWTMTFLSDGCLALTGYRPEELLDGKGITYNDLINPTFRENNYSKWEQDAVENRKSNDEYIIRTKSGEEKWVWEQSLPVPDKDGKSTEREGLILDITETKRMVTELDESEDRFRTIFEKAPIGIGIFYTNTGFVEQLNPKFEEILGRTTQELKTLDWRTYSHPAEIQTNLDKLDRLKKKETSAFTMQKRFIKPDGSIVWANMMIVPFKAETQSDMHLCMIQDITDNKRKEDKIIYLSYHDSLTGLYNRTFFEEEKKRLDVKRKLPLSVIMGDVNGLKIVNDTFGHEAGDILLCEISNILTETCRSEDIISRVGGDEFVLLLESTGDEAVEKLCRRIEEACKKYLERADKKVFALSISLGHATKTLEEQCLDDLLRDAEKMLYIKKDADRENTKENILKASKDWVPIRN